MVALGVLAASATGSEPDQPGITPLAHTIVGKLDLVVQDPAAFAGSAESLAAIRLALAAAAGASFTEESFASTALEVLDVREARRLQVRASYAVSVVPEENISVPLQAASASALQALLAAELKVCQTNPPGWVDSFGFACEVYAESLACTAQGELGEGWEASFGTIEDYAVEGISAFDACCACGGGRTSPLAAGLRVAGSDVGLLSYQTFGQMGGITNVTIRAPGGGFEMHEATPARWNAWQPKACAKGARWRCDCPRPPGPTEPFAAGTLVKAVAFGHTGIGNACGGKGVIPAPRQGSSILLVLRGECSFHEKLEVAQSNGYCGLVVANRRLGNPNPFVGISELPDMTVEPYGQDESVGIPAWLVYKRAGDALNARVLSGRVTAEIRDVYRKPALGQRQGDALGFRDYQDE